MIAGSGIASSGVADSPTYIRGLTLHFQAGSYEVDGNDMGLLHDRILAFDKGSYSVSGEDMELLYNRVLAFQKGSYEITGNDLQLLYNQVLEMQKGTYSITGYDFDFEYINYLLELQAGSYSIDGNDLQLLYNRVLALQKGSYTLTGYDLELIRALLRAKLARISVSRSGTSATVTLENFESGDLWNIYRAPVDDSGTGTYTKVKDSHSSATFSDTVSSGQRYKWRGAITFDVFGEQQKSRPIFSNPG